MLIFFTWFLKGKIAYQTTLILEPVSKVAHPSQHSFQLMSCQKQNTTSQNSQPSLPLCSITVHHLPTGNCKPALALLLTAFCFALPESFPALPAAILDTNVIWNNNSLSCRHLAGDFFNLCPAAYWAGFGGKEKEVVRRQINFCLYSLRPKLKTFLKHQKLIFTS